MEARSLSYIAEACQGRLRCGRPEAQVVRVCTDSRKVQPGDLFVALAGEKFDGHDFLTLAARQGALAVIAEPGKLPANWVACGVIEVTNTRRALGLLAARYRNDFTLPVIAVGGSNGKTTTKELLAAVLRQRWSTLWSEASFNNDIGVPLTLLNLRQTHQAAVLEVGTNHPGELAPLVAMIQPRYSVFTSLGREHLEFFGDLEGVATEEGWLAELLPPEGALFVPGDSQAIDLITQRTRAKVTHVGQRPGNDWRATRVLLEESGSVFWVESPGATHNGQYCLKLLGKHQVNNALFAIAIGAELGLSRDEIQRGLAECQPPKMRLQVHDVCGIRVLDDTYNANADSMLAALETLRDLPCAGRRVLVLGDMAELGRHSQAAHEEVGRRAAELGMHTLFAVGQWAHTLGLAARTAGLPEVREFTEVEEASTQLKAYLQPGDVVLIKASRAARLERMAAALTTELVP